MPARADHRRRWLAYGLQRANLVETMTVAENVALAAALRGRVVEDAEVEALVERLGLTAQRARRPACSPAASASGPHSPACSSRGRRSLVLDEPTSQQDDVSAARVVAALEEATRAGAAVLVASHDPAVLARADVTLEL